jgi:hypothetical protein
MADLKDGGPAFPRPISEDRSQGDMPDGNRMVDQQSGMSLRDYFAAAALTGLIASNDVEAGDRISDLPGYAYQIADAMLSERSPSGGA